MRKRTDQEYRDLPPKAQTYRISDGGSLFLCVRPSGSKSWEFRWHRLGKVRTLVLGPYPAMGLQAARKERDKHKASLAQGEDPGVQKKLKAAAERKQLQDDKAAAVQAKAEKVRQQNTFQKVAMEWLERHRSSWSPAHGDQTEQSLRDHAFPLIGSKPITEVTPADVLKVLDGLLNARGGGKLETAMRVRQRISAIHEFAALHHGVTTDPAALVRREFGRLLKLARRQTPKTNFACIPLAEAPQLFRALAAYTGPAGALVRFVALTACRTGEARKATIDEFDLKKRVWTVPPERMKTRKSHVVPLAPQVVELVKAQLRDDTNLLFPQPLRPDRPASENSVLFVLAALGYQGRMTGHGFRSLFSTAANESGKWRREAIEASLAHVEQDDVRRAYLRSDFLEERRGLMVWWATAIERFSCVSEATGA